MAIRNPVIITCYVLAVLSLAATADAAEIRFRSQARSDGSVVRLGDVAEVITPDGREREMLQALEIGPGGPARQILAARDVQDRLAAHGLKLIDHQFAGAAVINVLPSSLDGPLSGQRPLSKSAINLARTAVADAVAAHLKNTADAEEDWMVEVDLTADQARAISAQGRRATVTCGRAPWIGAQRFAVAAPNGKTLFTVEAEVKRSPRTVVAVNPIVRGERIRAADVELLRVKPSTPQRAAFQSLDEVIGKEAARNIVAGQALDDQYVRAPLLVSRGDVVDVFARWGGVQVRTKARAKDEGSHGELIHVELLSDRRPLLARVCGIQEVEVLAAGPSVAE